MPSQASNESENADEWGADVGRTNESAPFDLFWARFDRLGDRDRRRNWTELVLAEPTARASLTTQCRSSDVADRRRFVQVVRVCGLHEEYAEAICRLAQDPSPEVRSAAMVVVGRLPTSITGHLLSQGLNDDDPRVQANAVEAIGATRDKTAIDELQSKLTSTDNRVRANAIKVLLHRNVREAAVALLRMLQDPSPDHRISALWVIERMDLFSLISLVDQTAESDDNENVRQRAATVSQKLKNHHAAQVTATGGVPSIS